MFKLLNPNSNKNQFSWLYQLFREAGFTILKVEIKQLRKNDLNSSNFNQLKSHINNFYEEGSVNSENASQADVNKTYLDNNYKDLYKKENYKKTKKANTKPKK